MQELNCVPSFGWFVVFGLFVGCLFIALAIVSVNKDEDNEG